MKRALPLAPVLAFALLCGACTSQQGPSITHQAPGVFGNTASYDAYVERRSNDLFRAGVKSSEANNQAQLEARRRFGPRAAAEAASIGQTWGSTRRELKASEIDEARAKARN